MEEVNIMTEQHMQKEIPEEIENKYTVREVLDSLAYSVVDSDDDYDGHIHITSSINGELVKLNIEKLLKNLLRLKILV